MKIANSKIYKDRVKELPLAALTKSLALSKAEKTDLSGNVKSLTITGAIDKEIAKAGNGVELIYIIKLELKSDCVPTTFIIAFDKQTAAHTIFEIPINNKFVYCMARKTIKDGKISIGSLSQTEQTEEMTLDIQTGETLGDIYAKLYSLIIGLNRRADETAEDLEERNKRIKDLEKEIAKLEKKKTSEVQFNKKVAINEQIRTLKAKLEGEI